MDMLARGARLHKCSGRVDRTELRPNRLPLHWQVSNCRMVARPEPEPGEDDGRRLRGLATDRQAWC